MAYTPKTWKNGEVIKASDLNHLEAGVANASSGSGGGTTDGGGVGQSMAGKTVLPTQNESVTAGAGAEIFNDYADRTFVSSTGKPFSGNVASGSYSHAEGTQTTATGSKSHAEGDMTTAAGSSSHAEGSITEATGVSSHSEGGYTSAIGAYSHAEGERTEAAGFASHTSGNYTKAECDTETVVGRYNVIKNPTGSEQFFSDLFVVGDGENSSARSNAFRVSSEGVYGTKPYNSTGADYAEFFEWSDGNQDNEDRAGRFVTLSGDKIRLADPADDFILGIISGNPSVVGDVHDDQWQGMYLRDIFGRPLWEDVEVPDQFDQNGNVIIPAHIEHRQKLNPSYDGAPKYQPRSQRAEWDAVGMLGKLVAVDDGTCEANGWAAVGDGGIAVASKVRTRYRVMARLDDTHVRILIL